MAPLLLIFLYGWVKLNSNIGLVLMSGGARGAYQAGALRAIYEITKSKELPFSYLSGISAGSLNAAFLGCNADNFYEATRIITDIWYNIKPSQIFTTDPLTLTINGFNWIKDFSLGGLVGGVKGRSLLDTTPLKKLLNEKLNLNDISKNIELNKLKGIALITTNYYTGTTVIFFDGNNQIMPWVGNTKISLKTKLTTDHLLASSAIPFFFPAIKIDQSYYGDGCIRMHSPLSPSIKMGAEKILAIGVRHLRNIKSIEDLRTPYFLKYPNFAELGGVIFNAIFVDSLESDIAHLHAKNISYLLKGKKSAPGFNLKYIPTMLLTPSVDLETLVRKAVKKFPVLIQHFLKGMGASGENGWNLMSYLAFDSEYTSRLVELGYEDTLKVKNKISEFMEI